MKPGQLAVPVRITGKPIHPQDLELARELQWGKMRKVVREGQKAATTTKSKESREPARIVEQCEASGVTKRS